MTLPDTACLCLTLLCMDSVGMGGLVRSAQTGSLCRSIRWRTGTDWHCRCVAWCSGTAAVSVVCRAFLHVCSTCTAPKAQGHTIGVALAVDRLAAVVVPFVWPAVPGQLCSCQDWFFESLVLSDISELSLRISVRVLRALVSLLWSITRVVLTRELCPMYRAMASTGTPSS